MALIVHSIDTQALTVLEYLVAHGSERVIDEIREHAYQISVLYAICFHSSAILESKTYLTCFWHEFIKLAMVMCVAFLCFVRLCPTSSILILVGGIREAMLGGNLRILLH